MALHGNGPGMKVVPHLQHSNRNAIPKPARIPRQGFGGRCPRTVGDGDHDGLLGALPAASHCPHHVAAVTVRADDVLPAMLPGQTLQLLRKGDSGGLGPREGAG